MLNVWVCVCFCEWMLGAHLLTHVGGRHNETMSIPNRNKMVVYSCPWRSRLYCSSLIWKIIYLFCYPDSPRSLSTRASSRGRWKNRLKKKTSSRRMKHFACFFQSMRKKRWMDTDWRSRHQLSICYGLAPHTRRVWMVGFDKAVQPWNKFHIRCRLISRNGFELDLIDFILSPRYANRTDSWCHVEWGLDGGG